MASEEVLIFPDEMNRELPCEVDIRGRQINFFRRHPRLFQGLVSRYYPLDGDSRSRFFGKLNLSLARETPSVDVESTAYQEIARVSESPTSRYDRYPECAIHPLFATHLPGDPDWSCIASPFSDSSISSDVFAYKHKDGADVCNRVIISDVVIETYLGRWNWSTLSRFLSYVPEPWITRFADHWDWAALSHNQHVQWSVETLELYSDKVDWKAIGFNYQVKSSSSIIETLCHKFPDGALHYCFGEDIPVSTIAKVPRIVDWASVSVVMLSSGASKLLECFFDDYECLDSTPDIDKAIQRKGDRGCPGALLYVEIFHGRIPWTVKAFRKAFTLNIVNERFIREANLPWSYAFVDQNADILKDFYAACADANSFDVRSLNLADVVELLACCDDLPCAVGNVETLPKLW